MLYSKFNPFVIGIGLLTVPVFSLLISALLFVCGHSINPFIFPLSVVLSLLLLYFMLRKNHTEFIVSAGYHLFIIAFSIIASLFFYDYSCDGLAYHQETIFYLKNGWNPIYESLPSSAMFPLWIEHYAKGMETISATLYSTTGNIEAGKAVNFILLFASAFLFFHFLKRSYKISLKKNILLTFLFMLCPVVVVQIFTFYIDFAAYSLLLILISSLICFLKGHSKYDIYIICLVVFLSGAIKFNLFFWVLFTLFLYAVYAIVLKKYQLFLKMIVACAISALFSVFVAGFNPYVTNTIDHKNPFYPLAGAGKVDIITRITNTHLVQQSGFEKVMISLLSLPNNSKDEEIKFAFPHFLKKTHFEKCASPDARIGGFGILFSWILVLSIVLYIVVAFRKDNMEENKNRKSYTIFLCVLFASLFILPHAWWARYFPFFYAFPLIILLYSECKQQNKIVRIFRNLIYLLCLINLAFFCGAVSMRAYLYTKKVDKSIETMAKSKDPVLINFKDNIGLKIKLDKKNIPYKTTQEPLGTKLLIVGTTYGFFDSTKYVVENNVLIEKKP